MSDSSATQSDPDPDKDKGKAKAKGKGKAKSKGKSKKKSKDRGGSAGHGGARGGLVEFNKNIHINPQKPMPDKSAGVVNAYEAVGMGRSAGNFFAIISENHLVPRVTSASAYSAFINPAIIPLAGARVVYWPPAQEERYAFVYEDTLGPRLLALNGAAALGMRQEDVMNGVVPSLVAALQDFRDKDFFHGMINPHNIYRSNATQNQMVLGSCLAMPAGFAQPALYETIERAMADPIARGRGTLEDDLYALGVTLAVLLRSSDPLEGLSDEEITARKIEDGSYGAVTGKDRFKGSILELLRGLLQDDVAQRWTVDEVLAWMDGRRLSPKQGVMIKKASRPLDYLGKKYTALRPLAMDVDRDLDEVVRILDNGDLFQWLERSLEDEEAVVRVQEAQRVAADKGTGAGSGYRARLVANLCTALDPVGPLRFKNLRLMGEGIGAAMVESTVLKNDIKPFADLFLQKVAMNWITAQGNPNLDVGALVKRFDDCRLFLGQRRIGFGFERCLYSLSPEVHCLSDKMKGYCATTPEHLVKVFEQLAAKGEMSTSFIDRHSAAFLSVRDSKCIDSHLFDLDSSVEHKKILGNLKTLASIQQRSNMKPLPAIAGVFLDRVDVLYKRYHDKDVVKKIDKSVRQYAKAGDLVKMVGLLNNSEIVHKDMNGFKAAMMEYRALKREAEALEANMAHKDRYGQRRGRQVASIFATILSAIIILFMALMFKTGNVNF